jgi:hypothetical protein
VAGPTPSFTGTPDQIALLTADSAAAALAAAAPLAWVANAPAEIDRRCGERPPDLAVLDATPGLAGPPERCPAAVVLLAPKGLPLASLAGWAEVMGAVGVLRELERMPGTRKLLFKREALDTFLRRRQTKRRAG